MVSAKFVFMQLSLGIAALYFSTPYLWLWHFSGSDRLKYCNVTGLLHFTWFITPFLLFLTHVLLFRLYLIAVAKHFISWMRLKYYILFVSHVDFAKKSLLTHLGFLGRIYSSLTAVVNGVEKKPPFISFDWVLWYDLLSCMSIYL